MGKDALRKKGKKPATLSSNSWLPGHMAVKLSRLAKRATTRHLKCVYLKDVDVNSGRLGEGREPFVALVEVAAIQEDGIGLLLTGGMDGGRQSGQSPVAFVPFCREIAFQAKAE